MTKYLKITFGCLLYMGINFAQAMDNKLGPSDEEYLHLTQFLTFVEVTQNGYYKLKSLKDEYFTLDVFFRHDRSNEAHLSHQIKVDFFERISGPGFYEAKYLVDQSSSDIYVGFAREKKSTVGLLQSIDGTLCHGRVSGIANEEYFGDIVYGPSLAAMVFVIDATRDEKLWSLRLRPVTNEELVVIKQQVK
jgi:hypothetical protein